MLGVIVSREDVASVAIGAQVLALEDWDEHDDVSRPDADGGGTVYRTDGACLREFDDLHLDLDRPADAFEDPDLVVFASRHSGDTGALLTAHHTGNFGPANHGGAENELARACPNALDRVLDRLDHHAPEGYEVGVECTHHGPSDVGAPSMFVEVGSTETHWADPDATRAVARAILDLRGVPPDRSRSTPGGARSNGSVADETARSDWDRRHLVGFGGGHYAPRFGRVLRETDWAVGHVAADWGLDALGDLDEPASRAVLEQAFEQSRAAYALVEGDRSTVVDAVEALGYRAVSETWVRETDGVDLAFVRAMETALLPVDEGLRFGEPAVSATPAEEWSVVALPTDLLDEVTGIDRESTREALVRTCLAFETREGGSRPSGRIVLDESTETERVIDRLIGILEQRYDSVHREGDELVARVEEFDPERARTLGIPEGPAFGQLSAGNPVEVDGKTIPPEVVRRERVRRYHLSPEN